MIDLKAMAILSQFWKLVEFASGGGELSQEGSVINGAILSSYRKTALFLRKKAKLKSKWLERGS